MAHRLKAAGNRRYRNGFEVALHHDLIDAPLKWTRPRVIFVNSMSDLFHEKVPLSFIEKVFSTMNEAHRHIFQILTKRSGRLAEVSSSLSWSNNIWMGVTVESSKYLHRIHDLKQVPASVRFLSIEPLLSPINNLKTDGINWIITGGESGPKSRGMHIDWVRSIRDACRKDKVPFFFKQWGGSNKSKNGRLLDGKLWNEFPIDKLEKTA
jgi:protein gp37